jgi:hypothetical protein
MKFGKSRLVQWIGVGLLFQALPIAYAQTCSHQSLKGSYGYTVTGTVVSSVGLISPGPFGAVGRITFDGRGGVTTVRTLSDNGAVLQHDAGSGSYTLNSDCTGSFTISVGPPGNEVHLSLDIVLDGTYQLRGIVTNPGLVLLFEARRQFPLLY